MTPHNEAKKEDIASVVLMPGDPLRAKYIADNYLTDAKLVNKVRNMYAYTGYYKGTKVTVMASGMGCPSIGIYAYELYKFYDVKSIIRIGTSGSNHQDIKVLDVILATSAYTLSSFPKLFFDDESHEFEASKALNEKIMEAASKNGIQYKKGRILTSDVFDVYIDDKERYFNNFNGIETLASEMEAATLFSIAKHLNRDAACLITVVDSMFDKRELSASDRENSLNDMIKLALDSVIEL